MALSCGHGTVPHRVPAGRLLGVRGPQDHCPPPAAPTADGAGDAPSLVICCVPKVLSLPKEAGGGSLDTPQHPCLGQKLVAGGAQGVCPPPSQLGRWVTGQLCLLRLLIPFAPTRQIGAEIKTKITQNNPKTQGRMRRKGEDESYPCCGDAAAAGDRQPPHPVQGSLGEARQAPRAEQDGQRGRAGPSPPCSPAAVAPSVPPTMAQFIPPSPARLGPGPASPVPTGPCLQPGSRLRGRGAAGVGSQDAEGDAGPQPPRWVRRVPRWSRGGEGGPSSVLCRGAGPGGREIGRAHV